MYELNGKTTAVAEFGQMGQKIFEEYRLDIYAAAGLLNIKTPLKIYFSIRINGWENETQRFTGGDEIVYGVGDNFESIAPQFASRTLIPWTRTFDWDKLKDINHIIRLRIDRRQQTLLIEFVQLRENDQQKITKMRRRIENELRSRKKISCKHLAALQSELRL